MLFPIIDILCLLFAGILVITQVIIPMFTNLPIFWLFSKEGRDRVEFVFRAYWAQLNKQAEDETNKPNKNNDKPRR